MENLYVLWVLIQSVCISFYVHVTVSSQDINSSPLCCCHAYTSSVCTGETKDILVLMKSPPKLSSPHECLNTLVITFIRSHMTASICSCLARPQYFIIPSPLSPLQHNGCVLANWIIMTENRLCSDSLPTQAMHNGFCNTTGLIMAQLVSLNYTRMWKGPKSWKCTYRKERIITRQVVLQKKKKKGKEQNERNPQIHTGCDSEPLITLQVSSCDFGGFVRSGSPW